MAVADLRQRRMQIPEDRVVVELVEVDLHLHVHLDHLLVEKEIILQQLPLKELMVQLNLYHPMLTNPEQLAVVV